MSQKVKLLDAVALTVDLPEQGVCQGQVGTVVEELDEQHVLVEFCDDGGQTYALPSLARSKLLVLHYQKQETV